VLRRLARGPLPALAVLLVAIFFVSRGCQTEGIELTQEEAIEIAKEEVDFEPDRVAVRLMRRGVSFRPHWAVSLSQEAADGGLTNITIVVVDASNGEVVEVRRA
jgi:hypothetical protein